MKIAEVHARCLATSATLTHYYMPETILPSQVIAVLQRAKVPFVLVGAHGTFGWMGAREARPTKVVDVIVAARHHRRAVRALLATFTQLDVLEADVVTRLQDRETKDVLIDVMKPTDMNRAVFKHTHTVRSDKLVYKVPSLEMALVMKFAPMTSATRIRAKKLMDAHDFMVMVQANLELDLRKLKALGDFVYPNGGIELLDLIRRVRADEPLTI